MLCPEHKAEKFPVKKNGGRRASSRAAHNSSKEILSKLPERAGVGLSEETSIKWACSQSAKWVLCGSGLDAAGKVQPTPSKFHCLSPRFFLLAFIMAVINLQNDLPCRVFTMIELIDKNLQFFFLCLKLCSIECRISWLHLQKLQGPQFRKLGARM